MIGDIVANEKNNDNDQDLMNILLCYFQENTRNSLKLSYIELEEKRIIT